VTRAGQPHPHQQQQSNAALAAPTGGPPPRAKLVLLGDSGIGKSCLVLRYTRRQAPLICGHEQSDFTVGASTL
jgi:predicted ATP-dependent serine protease